MQDVQDHQDHTEDKGDSTAGVIGAILNIRVPQVMHVPEKARFPFFIRVSVAFSIVFRCLQRKQYASTISFAEPFAVLSPMMTQIPRLGAKVLRKKKRI